MSCSGRLLWLLGYQFSPRLADIGEATFWRIDHTADYGLLNNLARDRLNKDLIAEPGGPAARSWLPEAGRTERLRIHAHQPERRRTSTFVRAFAELGRIAETLFLPAYVDDEAYRRSPGSSSPSRAPRR